MAVTVTRTEAVGYQARSVEFPASLVSVSAVRDFARSALAGLACCDDAVSCVSELAANAAQYARGECFGVLVRARPDWVYLAVVDQGGGGSVPHVTDADGGALSGRGLALVSLLAREWGFVPTVTGGWHVWCEFAASDAGC